MVTAKINHIKVCKEEIEVANLLYPPAFASTLFDDVEEDSIFTGAEVDLGAPQLVAKEAMYDSQKLFAGGVLIKDKPSASRKAQAKRTEVRKG